VTSELESRFLTSPQAKEGGCLLVTGHGRQHGGLVGSQHGAREVADSTGGRGTFEVNADRAPPHNGEKQPADSVRNGVLGWGPEIARAPVRVSALKTSPADPHIHRGSTQIVRPDEALYGM
jgi:hypothetical protein